jgi:predicted DNA-binding ribbon-helix-helix protein
MSTSTRKKYSVKLAHHLTSVSLEPQFYDELKRMADARDIGMGALIAEIDAARDQQNNLSSALRLAVLKDLRSRVKASQREAA